MRDFDPEYDLEMESLRRQELVYLREAEEDCPSDCVICGGGDPKQMGICNDCIEEESNSLGSNRE